MATNYADIGRREGKTHGLSSLDCCVSHAGPDLWIAQRRPFVTVGQCGRECFVSDWRRPGQSACPIRDARSKHRADRDATVGPRPALVGRRRQDQRLGLRQGEERRLLGGLVRRVQLARCRLRAPQRCRYQATTGNRPRGHRMSTARSSRSKPAVLAAPSTSAARSTTSTADSATTRRVSPPVGTTLTGIRTQTGSCRICRSAIGTSSSQETSPASVGPLDT